MLYNEQEFNDAIEVIMNRVRNKYYFLPFLSGDDLAQESYLIALDVVKSYSPEKGKLSHFLSNAVKNRIKNVLRAANIRHIDCPDTLNENIEQPVEYVGNSKTTVSEFWELIEYNIPYSMRSDYIKYKNGVKIPIARKALILNKIREIIDDNNI